MRARSITHLRPAPCDPVDCNPAGSSAYGAFQARKLEWIAISLSGDGPKSGTEPMSPASPALAGGFFFFTARATWEAQKGSESATKNKTWSFTSSESEVAQSYLTLCDPMDCSLPGSSVHGIFQARILEWVAISFSRGSFRPKDRTQVSRIIGRRFIIWATREVHLQGYHNLGKEDRGPELVTGGGRKRR